MDLIHVYLTSLDSRTIVLYLIHLCIVFTKDVDIASVLLTNNEYYKKDGWLNDSYDKLAGVRLLGRQGILANPGYSIWHKKWKVMDKAFHRKQICSMFRGMKEFVQRNERLVDLLHDTIEENEVMNLYDLLGAAALDVIINTGFFIDENVFTPEKPFLLHAVNIIIDGMGTWFKNQQTFDLPWCFVEEKANIRKWLTGVRKYLKEHLEKRLSNEEMKSDILSHVIHANQSIDGFGFEEMIDELFVFFAAGMETTANSMSFTLLNVVKNKEVYNALQAEVYFLHQSIN